MFRMEMTSPQAGEYPSAMLVANMSDLKMNNNVLHRLVKPTEEGTEVVSVNGMVNVVPFRRIYRFDRKDELNAFCIELLKRPIVLQPVVHFGRGLGSGSLACGMCYKDDKWVMLINQTHPKILSRLQIGLDMAKSAMARGQSFEIRFEFMKMVERIYMETLARTEQDKSAWTDRALSYFRFAEWEYGDLILRCHGYAAMMGRGGGLRDMRTVDLSFDFEDLIQEEIVWKTLGTNNFSRPNLAPVTEDEIRYMLPNWTLNNVSPLEDIGDQIPAANYSYAQAGRLYESFRKKKRRPRPELADIAEGVASPPALPRPTVTDGIELRVTGYEDEAHLQQAYDEEYDEEYDDEDGGFGAHDYGHQAGYEERDGYQNLPQHGYHRDQHSPPQHGYHGDQHSPPQHGYSGDHNLPQRGYQNVPQNDYSNSSQRDYPVTQQPRHEQEPRDDGFYEQRGAKPKTGAKYDSHGHMYPDIRVKPGQVPSPRGNAAHASSPRTEEPHQIRASVHPARSPGPYAKAQSLSPYANLPANAPTPDSYASSNLRKSPYSSASPSGGAPPRPSPPPDDSTPLRNQFTRLRMQQGSDRSSHSDSGICSDSDGHVRDGSYEKTRYHDVQKNSPASHPYAMDNPGFHHEDTDVSEAMRKHKEMIAKMMSGGGDSSTADVGYQSNGQPRHASQSSDRDSAGVYAGRNGAPPSVHYKGGVPSPKSPNGQYGYASELRGQANSYNGHVPSSKPQVEESFI